MLIEHQEGVTGDELEREMFILRKLIEKEKAERMSATPLRRTLKPRQMPLISTFAPCPTKSLSTRY